MSKIVDDARIDPRIKAVMGAVPDSYRGVAAAILSTARTLGNTLGLGLAGAIFATVLAGHELTWPWFNDLKTRVPMK